MAQGSGKAFQQRLTNRKQVNSLSNPDLCEIGFFKREKSLDYDQWQNIAEDTLPWYEYNRSSGERRKIADIQRIMISCLQEIISSGLTSRQKEVITMYFLYNCTQVYIANKLGISQPTVNQHLNGKKRKGKNIGGSIRKIRKIIHQMSSSGNSHHSKSHIIKILNRLLDKKTSFRNSNKLIRSMLKYREI